MRLRQGHKSQKLHADLPGSAFLVYLADMKRTLTLITLLLALLPAAAQVWFYSWDLRRKKGSYTI